MRQAALIVASCWTLGLAAPALAQSGFRPPSELYRVEPPRVEQGPAIDGRLDEAVWQGAAVIDNFTQQEPNEGAPAGTATGEAP